MKNLYLAAAIMLAASAPYSFSADNTAPSFTGNINTVVGMKLMSKKDFGKDHKNLAEYGVTSDFGMTNWPVLITGSYLHASKGVDEKDSNSTFGKTVDYLKTDEVRLGVKKIFNVSGVNPYVSGGVSWISASVSREQKLGHEKLTDAYSDSAVGGFVATGVTWTIMEHLNLGAEVSYSMASADFGMKQEGKKKIGGVHAGLLIGYHF